MATEQVNHPSHYNQHPLASSASTLSVTTPATSPVVGWRDSLILAYQQIQIRIENLENQKED